MVRFSQAGLRVLLEMAQALALLPLYVRIAVAFALAAWIVLVADWHEFFPPAPPPAPLVSQQKPAEPPQVQVPEQKTEDRVAVARPASDLTGNFAVSDPRVGPDGSIREGEDGPAFFLSEIKSFSSKDVCTRADGERWACGLHAYATLRNSIAHKMIQCANEGSKADARISCRLGGENLALILVKNGLVELKPDIRDQALLAAQAKARSNHIGLWDR